MEGSRVAMSSAVDGDVAAQPLHGLRDAFLDPDLRLPAEDALGLAHVGPAAHDVDLERREMLERELVRIAPARAPDDLRDLGDRALVTRADVEVLVEPAR